MGVCLCVSHTRASLTLFTPSLRFFLILLWHFSFKQKIKTFPMATALKASLAFLPLSHPYPCQTKTGRESGGTREGGGGGGGVAVRLDLCGFVFDFLLTLEMD